MSELLKRALELGFVPCDEPVEEAVDLPESCICGNWGDWWWDGAGGLHCAQCDPPVAPLRHLAKSYLRRNTDGLPVEEVVGMARGLKGLMKRAGADGADRSFVRES